MIGRVPVVPAGRLRLVDHLREADRAPGILATEAVVIRHESYPFMTFPGCQLPFEKKIGPGANNSDRARGARSLFVAGTLHRGVLPEEFRGVVDSAWCHGVAGRTAIVAFRQGSTFVVHA